MLGSHLMWLVKSWQSAAYHELGRSTEADAAVDESISLNPTHVFNELYKALSLLRLGRGAEAGEHIGMVRRLGWDLASAERIWCRVLPNSPKLEADIRNIHALYAETESGA